MTRERLYDGTLDSGTSLSCIQGLPSDAWDRRGEDESYSSEENGLVERMHGVVLARVPSMLTNLIWGEAFAFAVEILNISPRN
ncbi:unnamed protein product [Phytophthora fragariaefolia]|uniref:Unnamed protein product n=1 Tax=Phytophthora fragariaefolia TaxID=1490495 RepID=A0A9W6Y090_9STRA|nr:unnamed protein product [Phytophthora fragariaefolia]